MLCAFFIFFYLSTLRLTSLQTRGLFYFSDDLSVYISLITVFVLLVSFIRVKTNRKTTSFVLSALLYFCIFVFVTTDTLVLFVFYEASLLPILYIILKWGSYPERSLRAILLLVYTIVFTLPFLYTLFYIYQDKSTLNLPLLYVSSPINSDFIAFVAFCAFAVKLPIYGLHFWLPMAHVEAPTFGSMILAGVLLKLGGGGLVRIRPLFDFTSLRFVLLSYSMLFLLYVTLVCCAQSDFKRLIAYSSVSHIMALVPLVLMSTTPAHYAVTLLILFHGLSSPLLFFLVGLSYETHSTRQLTILRGFALLYPVIRLTLSFRFFFTLRAPPFPSFIREVFFITRALEVRKWFILPLLGFTFFSLVYNLNWLSTLLFNSTTPTSNFQTLTHKSFTVMLLVVLITIGLLVILVLNDCN